MRRVGLCRAFDQPAVLSRDATGLPLTFNANKVRWIPAIYKYCAGGFNVVEAHGIKTWVLVFMHNDGAPINIGAASDPDIKQIPNTWTLDTVMTGATLTNVQAWLNSTDFGVTVIDGWTLRQTLRAIGDAMQQTAGFDPDQATA